MSLIRGDALTIPLADDSVDLIVTSPPYFALRSYTDACGTCGGESAAAITRGYSPRKCPNCERVFTSGRNKCHVCDVTTLIERETYDAAKAEGSANADPDCPECQGSGRGHYAGQIGSEPTPAAFIDALVAVTQECVRVLKPSGSMFVNLGDKYSGNSTGKLADASKSTLTNPERYTDTIATRRARYEDSFRPKSLMGLPWRYAIRCIDDLGLILRAEIIWSKPNGLPESVQDRVRRSHENWFHFTLEPRYYSAVDEIREPYDPGGDGFRKMKATWNEDTSAYHTKREETKSGGHDGLFTAGVNPLGKLPGSVWTIPTEPLRVPDHLPQHFAAFPSEFPRRIILGWSPSGICTVCNEGRRPVVEKAASGVPRMDHDMGKRHTAEGLDVFAGQTTNANGDGRVTPWARGVSHAVTGESCACPVPDAPTRPAVVLDPFAGTGTTVAVANTLGRFGVGVDLSADYLKLARWRCQDPGLRAKVLRVDKPAAEVPGQESLFA